MNVSVCNIYVTRVDVYKQTRLQIIMNESTDTPDYPVNFQLIWDDPIPSPCTTVRELSFDEFKLEYGIDPSVFDVELEIETDPYDHNVFNEGKDKKSEKNNKESPTVASSGTSCKFVDFSDGDVQTFIQEQSNKGTLKKTLCDVKKFENFFKIQE